MASADDSPIVLVTGATGFIASHLVKLLLEEGYRVRGSVRSLENEDKVKWLKEMCPEAVEQLQLVEADLTNEDCWTEAVKDCAFVMHVASPFPKANSANPEEEVIKPAVEGTQNILKACAASGTVRRVVLTSSAVAIHGETTAEDGKVYKEGDWTNVENQALDTYVKSKTQAERAAWDFVKELKDEEKFELAVINPVLVLGPVLNSSSGTSAEVIKRLLERSMPAVPKINFALCDVRDVAMCHYKAMTMPEAVDHRHLVCSGNLWYKEMAQALSKEFKPQGYNVPTMNCPYFALWVTGIFDKAVKMVLPRVGKEIKYDNERMKTVLGVEPHELSATLVDMAYSLIDHGVVKKTKKYKGPKKEGEEEQEEGGTSDEKEKDENGEEKPNGDLQKEGEEEEEEDLKKEKIEENNPEKEEKEEEKNPEDKAEDNKEGEKKIEEIEPEK